jgi:hypothetical protein
MLPKTATSYTWESGLQPANSYAFLISARDAAGNTSGEVGLLTTLPPKTTDPEPRAASLSPELSITQTSSSYISLAWTPSKDDRPYLFCTVYVNGTVSAHAGTNTIDRDYFTRVDYVLQLERPLSELLPYAPLKNKKENPGLREYM